MRISDWSSDVCSSYLTALGDVAGRQFLALAVDDGRGPREEAVRVGREAATDPADQTGEECLHRQTAFAAHHAATDPGLAAERDEALRSEERRVGKECVRQCRSRVSPDH